MQIPFSSKCVVSSKKDGRLRNPMSATSFSNSISVKTDFQLQAAVLPTVNGWLFHPSSRNESSICCIKDVERMRSIARNYAYWPCIDESIAQLVSSCKECASVAKTSSITKLESWPTPEKPWQRLHIDYAGPVDGWYYFILVDAYTKWPEVVPTKRITTSATLTILKGIFARFGIPETLVSDNGRQLVSDQFERYCDNNGILHLKTPPFHPQSNGLAERFVDTFKRALNKIKAGGEGLADAIDTFLLCYRSTPCRSAPQGKSPAELLLGRPIRTSLDLLKPPTLFHKPEESKQESQYNRKHGAKSRSYKPKDLVWAKVYSNNAWSWETGQVLERIGRVVYNVWLSGKQNLIRSHCNQMRQRSESNEIEPKQPSQFPLSILLGSWGLNNPTTEPEELHNQQLPSVNFQEPQPIGNPQRQSQHPPTATEQQIPILTRRSSRPRRVPTRYEPYHLY